jgi:protein involved in polysaccharide export with SLBB domain
MKLIRPTNRGALFVRLFLTVAGLGVLLGCTTVDNLLGWSTTPPKPKTATASTPSEDAVAGRLREGDELSVRIDAGPPGASTAVAPSDVTVDEDGYISLPLVGRIKASGLTSSELSEHIQANYVPRYYVRCTATVMIAQRFYYVGGEVRNPNRFLWSEDTTLMKAISTASGFTDYANHRKVQLVHGKDSQAFDADELQRNPSKDVPIRPGDTITVPRSIF